MIRFFWIVIFLFPFSVFAGAPLNPKDVEAVFLETYLHYFNVKVVSQECGKLVPGQAKVYTDAFGAWEERNKAEIKYVNRYFDKYFASRQQEAKELSDAAPLIMQEQYAASPYSVELCQNWIGAINDMRVMDYSGKFKEHFVIMRKYMSL